MEQKAHVVVYFYGKVVLSAVGVVALEDVRPVAEGQTVTEKTVCIAKVGNEEHHCIILYVDYVSSLDEVCRDVLFRGRKHCESLSKRWSVDLKDSLPDLTVEPAQTTASVPVGAGIPEVNETPVAASPVTAPTTAPPASASSPAEPLHEPEQPESLVIIKEEDVPARPPSVIFCGEVTAGYTVRNQSASNEEVFSNVDGVPAGEVEERGEGPVAAMDEIEEGSQTIHTQATEDDQADASIPSTNTVGDLGLPLALDTSKKEPLEKVDIRKRGRSAKTKRPASQRKKAGAKRPRSSSKVRPRPSTARAQSLAFSDADNGEENELADFDRSSDDDYTPPRKSHRSRTISPHMLANGAFNEEPSATNISMNPRTGRSSMKTPSKGKSTLGLLNCSIPTRVQLSTGQWVKVQSLLDGMRSQNSWNLFAQHVVTQLFTMDELKTGVCSPKAAAETSRCPRKLLDQTKLTIISGLVGIYCRHYKQKAPSVSEVNIVILQKKASLNRVNHTH